MRSWLTRWPFRGCDAFAAPLLLLAWTVDGIAGEQDRDAESGKPDTSDIPRFAASSPFDRAYRSPVPRQGKRLWAASRLWQQAPELVVEKWLGPEPDRDGKFLLIEFWATWCHHCRLAIPRLNAFHERFSDHLVVIGITDEDEAAARKLVRPAIKFPLAIDTQARMKKELAVKGIPHVIVVEPGGSVVWEGFPLLEGHELTEQRLAKIIEAGSTGSENQQSGKR